MEVWTDCRNSIESSNDVKEGIDRRLFAQSIKNPDDFYCDGNRIMSNEKVVGALVTINSEITQDYARSLVGSVEWLVIDFSDWSMIPIENIVLETDSPYLAPVPLRGKSNEPSYIIHTVKFLSKLKEISFEDLSNMTSSNFFNLFANSILVPTPSVPETKTGCL